MKVKRNILAILITLVLTLVYTSALPLQVDATNKLNKTKKASISATKVNITVGKSKTITMKNIKSKVKWSTSNKKVASIKLSGKNNYKCKIIAKKSGSATVKAKVGKKIYKCKITVKAKKDKTPSPSKDDTPSSSHEHTFELNKTVNQTCTSDGYDLYKCTKCDITEKRNIKSKTEHNYKICNTVEATCVTDGYTVYKCVNCGITENRDLKPKTGHKKVESNKVEPTCTADGLVVYKCDICGAQIASQMLNKLGHDFQLVSVIKESTYTAEGSSNFKCSRCNLEESKVTPKKEFNGKISFELVSDTSDNKLFETVGAPETYVSLDAFSSTISKKYKPIYNTGLIPSFTPVRCLTKTSGNGISYSYPGFAENPRVHTYNKPYHIIEYTGDTSIIDIKAINEHDGTEYNTTAECILDNIVIASTVDNTTYYKFIPGYIYTLNIKKGMNLLENKLLSTLNIRYDFRLADNTDYTNVKLSDKLDVTSISEDGKDFTYNISIKDDYDKIRQFKVCYWDCPDGCESYNEYSFIASNISCGTDDYTSVGCKYMLQADAQINNDHRYNLGASNGPDIHSYYIVDSPLFEKNKAQLRGNFNYEICSVDYNNDGTITIETSKSVLEKFANKFANYKLIFNYEDIYGFVHTAVYKPVFN